MISPSSAIVASLFGQFVIVSGSVGNANHKFVISIEAKLQDVEQNWPNFCMDVVGESTENGTPVWLWECAGNVGQEWIFDDGKLKSAVSTDKCLDAGGMVLGSQLQIWDCVDLPQQQWGYDQAGEGVPTNGNLGLTYTIYLLEDQSDATKCLGLADSSPYANGAPIQVAECTQADNQLWYGFETAVEPYQDTYATLTVSGHEDFCLDLPGQSTDNGTPIQIWTCADIDGQRWFLTQRGQIRSAVDGTKCLNVDESGVSLQLWDCGPESDRWFASGSLECSAPSSFTEDCTFRIEKQFHIVGEHIQVDFCIEVQDGVYADGSGVEVRDCSCGPQDCPDIDSWAFRNLDAPSPSPPASGLCVQIPYGKVDSGVNLAMGYCDGSEMSQWSFEDGMMKSAADPSKCVDLLGGASAGSKLGLWDCIGVDSQQWMFDYNGTLHWGGDSNSCIVYHDIHHGLTDDLRMWNCDGLQGWMNSVLWRDFSLPESLLAV